MNLNGTPRYNSYKPSSLLTDQSYQNSLLFANAQPKSAQQVLHYNNLIRENQQLKDDIQVILIKLQKHQKLQPYIQSLIAKNSVLVSENQRLHTQNTYLGKNIKQLHVQNKRLQNIYQNRIKQLNQQSNRHGKNIQNVYQNRLKQYQEQANSHSKNLQSLYQAKIKQMQQHIQVGKDNGNRVRLQNQNLMGKLKIHVSEIQQYKRKLQEVLTEKIQQEQIIRQARNQRDKLQSQLKQLQSYNKEIVRNAKLNQDSHLQKIQYKQKLVKGLQKQKQQLNIANDKLKEQIAKMNINLAQLQQKYTIICKNHQMLLNDHRLLNLKKVQMEYFLEQSLQKIERRQDQLRQIQMFREEQRSKYQNQILRMQVVFEEQKSQLQQAIKHKSLKNQKLLKAYNEIMQKNESLQKLIWQLQNQMQKRTKQKNQLQYKNESHLKQIQQLKNQILILRQKQQKMIQTLHGLIQQKQRLSRMSQVFQKQFQMRQLQFEEYVRNLRIKYEYQKQKWSQLFQQQKSKMRATHQYDKKQIETYLNKRLALLQLEVQEYRGRISKGEDQKIQRAEKQVLQARNFLNLNSRISNSIKRSNQNSREKQKTLLKLLENEYKTPRNQPLR